MNKKKKEKRKKKEHDPKFTVVKETDTMWRQKYQVFFLISITHQASAGPNEESMLLANTDSVT
jgi:hypothetical protein